MSANPNDPTINWEKLAPLIPHPGRFPILQELSTKQQVALLCRVLFQEGYNDHIAGHVTYRQDDGTMLVNPWELAWDEVCASDILTIDANGKVLDGRWNVTPAINVHRDMHALRHDVRVVIHNHSEWGSVWAACKRVPPIYDQTSALSVLNILLATPTCERMPMPTMLTLQIFVSPDSVAVPVFGTTLAFSRSIVRA